MVTEIDKNTVLCLTGPTASGKSSLAMALAMDLAQTIPIEIISVDSAMVYQGMDIGSAKPTKHDLNAVPHHLIDIVAPTERYSAGDFCRDARIAIDAIHQRGNLPLLVGGTMMYFQALQAGMSLLPEADAGIRQQLEQEAEQDGWITLYWRLQQCDPEAAAQIHPNDQQRIQRALEVFMLTGEPISSIQKAKPSQTMHCHTCALMPSDRAKLHQRIAERVDDMIAQGLDQEVRQLWALPGMHERLPSMRSVGYRQWLQWILGKMGSQQEAIDAMNAATRQLAKRQITWLRSWNALEIIAMEDDHRLRLAKDWIHSKINNNH